MIYQKLYKIKQYIVSLGQKNLYKFRFRTHGRADAPTRFSFNNTLDSFIMAGVMFYFFVSLVQNEKIKNPPISVGRRVASLEPLTLAFFLYA